MNREQESRQITNIQNEAVKGNWDEVSRLFSEMSGMHVTKGDVERFILSEEMLTIVDHPEFAKFYGFSSSLQAIFDGLHKWVYPGESIFLAMPGGRLKVWPRESNNLGRKENLTEKEKETDDEEYFLPEDHGMWPPHGGMMH